MRRLSRNNNIRLGIIFLVTGLIGSVHWALTTGHNLPGYWDLILGIILILLSIPFLVVALRYNSREGQGGAVG